MVFISYFILMKKSLFLWLLIIGSITLVWCQKSGWETELSESKYPVAEQVCVDNGWEVTIDEEGEDVCLLDGRAIYLADMEENPELSNELAVTSLELGDLINIIENNFPKAYDYTITNIDTNESEKWTHVYTLDELGFLTPEYSNIVDREVTSSGIEDGMIYTMVKATLDDGKQIDVLYIVDPVTFNFVAANIEDGDIFTNYQFTYFVESLTYADLEEIAKSYFPASNTYTIYNFETEETSNGENVYMEDTPHNLTNITPDFGTVVDQNLLSSAIEDGMIYSNFDVTYDNGTTGNVLYINNPESLLFVAATVENEGNSINYQFSY